MKSRAAQTMEISVPDDVAIVRRMAKTAAEGLGFDPIQCEEISIVVTELATNLIKHAHDGSLTISEITEPGQMGMEIESHDCGPGIIDVEQALTDRFSTVDSRGTGLGAVNRLTDELEIISPRGKGTHINCRKWIRHHIDATKKCPLDFGVATRPSMGNTVNGDAFVVQKWSECALVGIIDGLGHGPFAHCAAQAARQYIESHFDQPLDRIFRGTNRACRATRGVVMALACFDWGAGRLDYASIGNIEVRIFPSSKPFHFSMRRGVIGLNAPEVVITRHLWPVESILVLHSDGVTTHWNWDALSNPAEKSASVLAQSILQQFAKNDDDATVIVVRSMIQ